MGADITFYKDDREFYFRDSYNSSNLAWVVKKSYWAVKRNKRSYIAFFVALSKITDKQIDARVDFLFEKERDSLNSYCDVEPDKEAWRTLFRKKRNSIKKALPIIRGADTVEWSV